MVSNDKSICQNCGSKLKRYDKVSRIVRTKGGKTSWIEIERFRCPVCGQIHRELPDYIFPYKQYEAEVIRGVLEGFITCETYVCYYRRGRVRREICGGRGTGRSLILLKYKNRVLAITKQGKCPKVKGNSPLFS